MIEFGSLGTFQGKGGPFKPLKYHPQRAPSRNRGDQGGVFAGAGALQRANLGAQKKTGVVL